MKYEQVRVGEVTDNQELWRVNWCACQAGVGPLKSSVSDAHLEN